MNGDNLLDEDDDAWSYSFPPSTESLPLPSDNSPEFEKVEKTVPDQERIESDLAILNDHLRSASNSAGKESTNKSQLSKLRDLAAEQNGLSEEAILKDDYNNNNINNNINNNSNLIKRQSNSPLVSNGPGKADNGVNLDNESISSNEYTARPKDLKDNDEISQISSKSSYTGPIDFNRKDYPSSGSAPQSLNSFSLQSPFLSKATPANPLTTKEDASSVISRESQKNALTGIDFSNEENLVDKLLESPKRNSSDFRSNSNATISLESHKRNLSELNKGYLNNNENGTRNEQSPKVITYRKSRRTTSEGNFQDILESAVSSPKEKYDPRLYDELKFKDTKYRYAAMRRNVEFHELFTNLDLTERLIDDFACALSREILLQGRIYVSENHICFNSSLLGWVTNVVIALEDVVAFEKRLTAGIFPNGIAIETKDEKYTFASFLSRDSTFTLLQTIWELSTGKKMITNDEKSVENSKSLEEPRESDDMEDDRSNIESYIMSIDEDGNGEKDSNSKGSSAQDLDNDSMSLNGGADDEVDGNADDTLLENKMMVIRLKPDSKYEALGPEVHKPTEINDVLLENETELCNEVIDAPMGIVFEILFSSTNDHFFQTFLQEHESSDLSSFDKFTPKAEEPEKLHRTYTYKKALGYSIGPKSTTCDVEEIIDHLNFNDYIQVTSITKTPDVPLGNAFCVKTKYRFTWARQNKTNLQISYLIEWTGRSWIKSVIEKLTLTGQTDACKDLLASLKKEIEDCTMVSYKDTTEKEVRDLETTPEAVTPEAASTEKVETTSASSAFAITVYSTNKFIKENIVLVCYLIFSFLFLMLVLQLMMFRNINETNALIKDQMTINSYLVQSIQALSNNAKIDDLANDISDEDYKKLWDWVDEQHGRKLSSMEKLQYLTLQLNSMFQKQNPQHSISGKFNEFTDQVKGAMDGIL